jgi:hypothetical protein
MRAVLRFLGLAVVTGALASMGCAEESPAGSATEEVGSAELALVLSPGLNLNSISYTITGPNAFSRMGSVDLSKSSTVSFTVGGLPAGNGYNIVVTGTASDGATTCGGSATFAVMAKSTSTVMLHLLCRESAKTGSAMVVGNINICPLIDALSASPNEVQVGGSIALVSVAHDTDSAPGALAQQWTATAGSIVAAGANATFTCTSPGPATVTLTVTDTDCTDSTTVALLCTGTAVDAGAVPDTAPPADVPMTIPNIKINEVESNGGTPGDWVELYNAGSLAADVSGWVFKDNDDSHNYAIPAGTIIPPGGFYVLEEGAFGFGLGAMESARIWTPGMATLVDVHTWTAHAPITYSRCPDGSGAFIPSISTKGAANACGSPDAGAPPDMLPLTDMGTATVEPWPGQNNVVTGDNLNQFGDNLSGLTYEPGATPVLWAALNGPGTIYRLVNSGGIWTFDTGNDWGAGKALHYPGGTGNPDTESLTRADMTQPFVYVSTERNNDASSVSRLAVLRFDSTATGTQLTATHEWNLTADLPAVGANLGLEAITWIPDTYLVANGFFDDSKAAVYNPALYPNHGNGLFVLGVEANGMLFAYALDHATSAFQRVASFTSGHTGVMGLEFDKDSGALWAACDNTCAGVQNVLGIVAGKFVVRRSFARPSTLPDSNNEGIGIAPDSECSGGFKKFFWADDSHFAGHALRIDSIPCGPLF